MCSDLLVRVEHNSQGGSEGIRGEVLGESCSHHTAVTVAGNNFSPSGFVVSAVDGVLGSVHVSDALSVVEDCIFAVVASLNFKESLLLMLVSLTTLVTGKNTLDVKSVHT